MEKFLFTLIFIYSIINPIFPTTHFESSQRYLHVYSDASELDKPLVIKSGQLDAAEGIHQRYRRDLPSSINENLKNILTKVNTQTTQENFSLLSALAVCATNKVKKLSASFQLVCERPARDHLAGSFLVMLAHGS